ncbi:MAG TPA: hypothetical protein VN253_11425 [Kofleriaceae bacterium]|nr:hypothetical protein [Kofleriaceae bacterium]
MPNSLVPRDYAEAVALFRAELRKLAERKYWPPGRRATKRFGASTLERWYYAYKRGGLETLRPDARARTAVAPASCRPRSVSCCSTSGASTPARRRR